MVLLAPATAVQAPTDPSLEQSSRAELEWNRRNARHLLNRAGFGGSRAEIDAALAMGLEHVVEQLLHGGREVEPPFYTIIDASSLGGGRGKKGKNKRDLGREIRKAEKEQSATYVSWWIDRMVEGEDPLRDRMTLFWHGLFTTSARDIRRTYEVIEQHQFLRNHALESYATLLAGIVENPAMLYYLDNTKNKKGEPNENLARELMELFSLGEGNYTERDVQEVARALTGNQARREGGFRFNAKQHDKGRKTILGQTGRFRGQDVVRILLEQEACARWISGRIIEYFEGVWPDEERHAEYASFLKSQEYELRPFLEKLLLDPRFYRDEVVGTRVMGPIDYLVGVERRLGLDVPPFFIYSAGKDLGQTLFQPPNVKGWEGGEAWITTASLLGRGNVAGMMLGVLKSPKRAKARRARGGDEMGDLEMDTDMEGEMSGEMDDYEADNGGRRLLPSGQRNLFTALGARYTPKLHLTWRLKRGEVVGDREIVNRLLEAVLAIEAPQETREALVAHLAEEREAARLRADVFLEYPRISEPILRRLMHLILSLPEAQLN